MNEQDKEIVYLKRLYLDKGLLKNNVSIYSGHLERLRKIDLNTLKLLYSIYENILILMEENFSYIFTDIKLHYNNIYDKYNEDDKLRRFLVGRMSVTDVNNYLNDNWRDNLKEIEKELTFYYDLELIDIYVKGKTMKDLIETFIIIKDDLWLPSNLLVVNNMSLLGYSIEKEKERIWQPKS